MAEMKNPKGQIALLALKDAADSMDDDTDDMAKDAMLEMCTCPKCGYEGTEDEFKKDE